jgi:hypothetical protein
MAVLACGCVRVCACVCETFRCVCVRECFSYHVNTDEAYSLFNGIDNEEFDIGVCRLQVGFHLRESVCTPCWSRCAPPVRALYVRVVCVADELCASE